MSKYFEDNSSQEGLGRKSLRGGVISIAGRAMNAVIQIATLVVLARLLTPEDFGLVAMVTALIGFAPVLIDLGTSDAATQKSRITPEEVSGLFWLNMALGGGIAFLVAAASPLIARMYGEERLRLVALVASLQFIFLAAACQHYALLRRAMMFQRIVLVEVCGNFLSAVIAIAIAFHSLSYWALVARPVLTACFTSIGIIAVCRWVPGIPRLTEEVKQLLKFGMNITGFTMLDFIGRSSDRVALGLTTRAQEVGYYQQSVGLYENPLYVITLPLHGVAVASLSKLRDNLDELRRSWAKALSHLAFYGMPAFGGLALLSHDLIVLMMGEKWAYAGTLLSVIAVRGVVHILERTLGWLHVAAGRADRWRRWGLISTICQLVAVGCGLPFGAMGVAISLTVVTYVLFIPTLAYAGQPLGIGARLVWSVVWRPLVAALASIGLGFAVQSLLFSELAGWLRILLSGLTYSSCYLVLAVCLLGVREPLTVIRTGLYRLLPVSTQPLLR